MKRLRFPLTAMVLALVLSTPAFAGDMWAGITSPPPSQSTTPTTGDIQAGATTTDETMSGESTAVDPVTETALQLMVSVLSLF